MKNNKKIIALLMAALMMTGAAAVFTSCGSSDSGSSESKEEAKSGEQSDDDFLGTDDSSSESASESELYKKAVELVSKKGVKKYTCCKLQNSANYYIVTIEGDDYKFYKVALKGPKYEGELDADDTEAYIDFTTATLGIYEEDDGKWEYGLVTAGDKITCETTQKGSTNKVPKLGGKAKFADPKDTTQLKIFS